MGNTLYVFPEYYTTEAISKIMQNGKEERIEVYRVGKYGKDKSIAFFNYYEEVIMGYKFVKPAKRESILEKYSRDIDSLSVSCYYLYEDIDYYYSITLKETNPERILLKGITSEEYGLTQITSERKPKKTDSHTDWWLFKSSTPWVVFEEVSF